MSKAISITGDLASGKSTLAQNLIADMGLKSISVGGIVRSLAENRHINVLEANRSVLQSAWMDQTVDAEVDKTLRTLEAEGRDYLIDARVGFHYSPESFKIKLVTHSSVSAARAFSADRQSESYATLAESHSALQERHKLERKRFLERYGIDIDDLGKFDLVVDTTFIEKHQTSEIVRIALEAWENEKPYPKYWCHPAQIIPGGQTNYGDFKTEMTQELIEDMADGHFDFTACCNHHLANIDADKTPQGDLLLRDGHHRIAAAHVASLPYIGLTLRDTNASFHENVFRNMNFNYDAIEWLAAQYIETNPDRTPVWGHYNNGVDFTALNKYKFDFIERFLAWRDRPKSSAAFTLEP